LDERLEAVKRGELPESTDLRHFFYMCRNMFLRENPGLSEVDCNVSNPMSVYIGFEATIRRWCEKNASGLNLSEETWWRVREALNMWAEARSVCSGESGEFLVSRERRAAVSRACSFILICEKKTVSRKLLEVLKAEGYRLNLVSTGGRTQSDVVEAIISVGVSLEEQGVANFYCLFLHDYDIDGVTMYLDLRKHFPGVIDVGVNGLFIEHLRETMQFDPRLVEENRLTKKNLTGDTMRRFLADENYTQDDWNYLYGTPVPGEDGKTYHLGKRVEIDAVEVQYGINPFVDFIKYNITQHCRVWDLSRIGVSEFSLEEPADQYEEFIDSFNETMGEAYAEKRAEVSEPANRVVNIVRTVLGSGQDPVSALQEIYAAKTSDEITGLLWNTAAGMNWAPGFADKLEAVNDQIKSYEGDVREGAEDLSDQADDIQAGASC
jgi:hypothetical protein